MHFMVFVLVGLIVGALAGRVVGARGHGMLGDITVGMVGAFFGGWIFTVFGDVAGGAILIGFFAAVVGAVVLLWAIRLIVPARF